MPDWVQGMKKLAMQVYEEGQPSDICFGTVLSDSPLSIDVEQKQILSGALLVLTDAVQDYTVEFDVMGEHVTAVIPNALKAGEKVVMLQKKGGQKYVVIGRIGGV